MFKTALRLSFGIALILASSGVLLLTDRGRSRSAPSAGASGSKEPERVRNVAIFQHVSQPVLEEGVRGVLAGLSANGFEDGGAIRVKRFNAEGDAATSNAIARELVGAEYDLIVTVSTPSLQAVAGANRDAKVPHVFGVVSDPVAAGVGIVRDDPMKHPPYMVGYGTMQPVAETFHLARKLNPALARVGVPWNPSEANAEACLRVARPVCKELKIDLLEANVENSAAVREAVASLIGRGAEAIWVGGDTTVLAALDSVMGPARSSNIPVFTSIPGSAARGSLFDLGADYYQVGVKTGQIASEVLGGRSPATMPIVYEVPPNFWINRAALDHFKSQWVLTPELDRQVDVDVQKSGPVPRHPRVEPTRVASRRAGPSKLWTVGIAGYMDSTVTEDSLNGIREGLRGSGLVEGKDYQFVYRNAQGDIATLNAILDEFNGGSTDLVVTQTTPGLQAAVQKVDQKPLVFALVLDPFIAGAGKSDREHRPNITGAYLTFPFSELVQTVHEVMPSARRVGTLFTPGEANSVLAKERFEKAVKQAGLDLVALPVTSPTEVSDTALTLCQSGIDLVCQISDSLSNATFPSIARACETSKVPLFSFAAAQVKRGAILSVGSDYVDNGKEAAGLVAEIIRGADPARIPFRATAKVARTVNPETARRYGVTIPEAWLKTADVVGPAGTGAKDVPGNK